MPHGATDDAACCGAAECSDARAFLPRREGRGTGGRKCEDESRIHGKDMMRTFGGLTNHRGGTNLSGLVLSLFFESLKLSALTLQLGLILLELALLFLLLLLLALHLISNQGTGS